MSNVFVHSVRVPRIYKIAAKIAKDFSNGVASIKDLVYGNKVKHPNLKAIYSLVSTLFQNVGEIETLLKRSQILEKEPLCDPWLIKILIVELIWGKGAIVGQSKPESVVRGYEQIFKAHLTNKGVKRNTEGLSNPRYVRVNTLTLTTAEAIENFQEEGWMLSKFSDKNDYDGFLQKISTLNEEFMVDLHIPDLLIFPRKTEFHRHPAYQKGSILLQDKASCLPVHILAPPPGSTVLDMCAAPGMKTTHLASAIKDQGVIYAVERDPKRFKGLENMISNAGTSCVKAINRDVLDCSGTDFPDVEYILVDPSCSGSGMLNRYFNQEEISPERLQKLAGFQIKILRSALTRYPNAKRVVYSTCSVLPEENEDVVRQVLETNYNFKLVAAKQFIDGAWKNFGHADYGELGACCLYTKPDEDFTNGFFVAVFERLAEGEVNKFFNNRVYSYKRGLDKKERKKVKRLEREQMEIEENGISGNNVDNTGICDQSESNNTETVSEIYNGDFETPNCEENTGNFQKKREKRKLNISEIHSEVIPDNNSNQGDIEFISKKKKKKKSQKVEGTTAVEHSSVVSQVYNEDNHEISKKDESDFTGSLDNYLNNKICSTDLERKKQKRVLEIQKDNTSLEESQCENKRKKQKREQDIEMEEPTEKKKKKKNKNINEVEDCINLVTITENNPPKKKKKAKSEREVIDVISSPEETPVLKKKKKRDEVENNDIDLLKSTDEKKKKKTKEPTIENDSNSVDNDVGNVGILSKKKKKKDKKEISEICEGIDVDSAIEKSKRKKKRTSTIQSCIE